MPTGLPWNPPVFYQGIRKTPLSKSKEILSTNNYILESTVFLTVLQGGSWVDNYTWEVKAFIWKTLNTATCLSCLKAD